MNEVHFTTFAGIDWGAESHHVCVHDSEGTLLGEKAFAHSGKGLSDMVDWILDRAGCDASRIAVAIEIPHGPVVDTLMDRGFQIGTINPKQSDRFRDRFSPAGAKDDRRDAQVLASAIRTDPKCFRWLKPLSEHTVRLRERSRRTDQLIKQRTAITHQIRQQLRGYFPQFLDLGGHLYDAWILELWKLIRTPKRAKRVRLGTVAALMKKHRIRRITPEQVLQMLRSPSVHVAIGVTDAAVDHILDLVEMMAVVNKQLRRANQVTKEIIQKMEAGEATVLDENTAPSEASAETSADGNNQVEPDRDHNDITILRSIPGVGIRVLSTLLSEGGNLLEERNYKALRCLGGVAPVTRRSGKTISVMRRQAIQHRLSDAIYHWANVILQHDPISKAKYRALRARGHSHGRALRTIGDRLLAIACAMLRNGTLFDPNRQSRGTQT